MSNQGRISGPQPIEGSDGCDLRGPHVANHAGHSAATSERIADQVAVRGQPGVIEPHTGRARAHRRLAAIDQRVRIAAQPRHGKDIRVYGNAGTERRSDRTVVGPTVDHQCVRRSVRVAGAIARIQSTPVNAVVAVGFGLACNATRHSGRRARMRSITAARKRSAIARRTPATMGACSPSRLIPEASAVSIPSQRAVERVPYVAA